MKRFLVILFFSFFYFHFVQAQIAAPDFLCVRADTLFWNLPTNSCGPFVSYDIFSSTDFSGPYTLIGSVTNPLEDFYFDLNPGGEQRWYYLQSNFNCPGEPVLSSDTLDNRPPEISPIRSLKVQLDGSITLEWQASPSPEVVGYIIYRETNLGVVPVDTVYGATDHLDLGAMGNDASERYFVNSLDACGTSSIFDLGHRSIFLEGELVPCEQGIALTWNLYENWSNGIGSQEVWLNEVGAPPTLVETLDGSTDNYTVTGLTDGIVYEITLHAIEANTGDESISNQITFSADIVQNSSVFLLENVNVLPDNSVELTWSWNDNAELSAGEILTAPQNNGYVVKNTFAPPVPLPEQVQFFDENSRPDSAQVYYRIQSIDDCGDASTSTYGSTIFLTATSLSENSNQLNWTAFDIENSTADSYNIFRIEGGNETFLASVGIGDLTYVDEFSPADLTTATLCYRVEAQGESISASGQARSISSSSNIACAKQDIRIFVPNALAPDGFNREFKPVIGFGQEVVEYEMEIYDRYGAQVFSTKEMDEGWRGKKDGKKLPQGVYVYKITVKESTGNVVERNGTLLLVR